MAARSPTSIVVGALIGVGLICGTFYLTGWRWGLTLSLLLAYEGWTLTNRHRYDTISDIIRAFSRRQLLIPWLFGLAFGISIKGGYLTDPYVIAALAVAQGHFFFTLDENRVTIDARQALTGVSEVAASASTPDRRYY